MYQKHSLTLNGVEEEVKMTKVKTEEKSKPSIQWSPKEKEDLKNKYGTELLVENANQEQMSNKYLPTDAYVVTYKNAEGNIQKDITRSESKVNLFDMYYDKFGENSIVAFDFGPGTMSPKLWGINKPAKPKRRRKKEREENE